jgi:ATP-dependent Lon protease
MPKRKDKESEIEPIIQDNTDTNDIIIDNNDNNIDINEYYELLSELYPSNYINEKRKKIMVDEEFINNIREIIVYLHSHLSVEEFKKLNKLYTLFNTIPNNLLAIQNEIYKKLNIINKLLDDISIINLQIYNKYIQNNINDNEYFKQLKVVEQDKILTKLKQINLETVNTKPHLIQLLESNMPTKFKHIGLNKIIQLRDKDNNEYQKLIKWVESFLKLPFNKVNHLPVSLNDGIDNCRQYMSYCETVLNNCVYGMEEAKGQIMQLIGKWITNPQSIGTAIGLKGPMGTGKTTLVKNGISKILNREFAFITLGGSVDGSTLKGHSYTYEGSTYGKIADILIQTKTSNPIIFFDELDKVSKEEIFSVLTHLTDTTQNSEFHDNYFSEIELDLSACLFVFSFNDESLINPILRDRMYTIEVPGYNVKDKIIISQQHLIPCIIKDLGLKNNDIIISEENIKHIIINTKPEDGVRNLKRSLEIIYSKLNLFRILKSTTIFDKIIDVSFPFHITKEIIDNLLKCYKQPENMNILSMYI